MERFNIFFPFLFVLAITDTSLTAPVTVSKCPDVKPVENFNMTDFLGTWNDVGRYPIQMEGLTFISYDVKQDDGNWIVEEIDDPLKPNPKKMVSRIQSDPENRGIISQNLSYGTPPVITVEIKEYILSAVYDKYYISYVCLYDEKTKTFNEYSTVAARSKNPSDDVKTAINEFIKSSDILHADKYEWNPTFLK